MGTSCTLNGDFRPKLVSQCPIRPGLSPAGYQPIALTHIITRPTKHNRNTQEDCQHQSIWSGNLPKGVAAPTA